MHIVRNVNIADSPRLYSYTVQRDRRMTCTPRMYLILLDICTILDRRDRFLSCWNIEYQTSM